MIRTIISEFDCVDSAEIAATAIKKNILDIIKISIKPKKSDKFSYHDTNKNEFSNYVYNMQSYPYNTNLYGFPIIVNIPKKDDFNQPKEVILKIECSNDCLKKVSSFLVSYGALNIKEL